MDLQAIRDEVKARGFDYLSSTRLDYFINRAYNSIAGRANWPFLQATASGTSPLTISDLRQVLSVKGNTVGMIRGEDARNVLERDPNLEVVGTPERWTLPGENTVTLWPASASETITVRYLKVPASLSASTDTPIIPARFHYALVDGAVLFALRDDDEHGQAMELRASWEADIREMKGALLDRNLYNPSSIIRTRGVDDYGA